MNKKMKTVLALLLVAMVTLSLAACGTTSGNTADGGKTKADSDRVEDVILTMYMNQASPKEAIAAFREEVVDVFERENEGVKIDIVMTEDSTGLATQQIAAGGGPDILTVEPSSVQLFAEAGYLQELNTYAEEFGWYDLFEEWALKFTSRGDSLYALPSEVEGLGVFYNKDMFAENGWEVPTTYKEYIDLCEAIKAVDIIPTAFGNSDFKGANQWWIAMGYSVSLGQETYHALLQGNLSWEGEELQKATDQLTSMWDNGYIYENSAGITMEDSRNLFVGEQAAMLMSGQWEIYELLGAEPTFEWGAFRMPAWNDTDEEGALPIGLGGTYAINKHSNHPEWAAKFLDYAYADDAVLGGISRGVIVPTTNCEPSEVEGLDRHYVEMFDLVLDAMETGNIGYCAWTYWPPAVDAYGWNNFEALYLGQLSRDEFLRNLQEKFDEALENGNVLEF